MKKADPVLEKIAKYVTTPLTPSQEALETAKLCLMDTLGCAFLALKHKECKTFLSSIGFETNIEKGCFVPGINQVLHPFNAGFTLTAMIRWLDFNDTFLAKEWAHPSDNIGGILAICDYLSRNKKKTISIQKVFEAIIKAYEIQGSLALENSFNQKGIDHVIGVKIASTAVCTYLLNRSKEKVINALSQAFIDLAPLRTYRHYPNTGPRKSWAAADASQRALFFSWISAKGEKGYPYCLSAKQWGVNDCIFPIKLPKKLNYYIIENILFKVAFPAEFHGQTAVEAALLLHDKVKNKINQIQKIEIETQKAGKMIIDKQGVLQGPSDRDHCLQYMVAVALLFGKVTDRSYKDIVAKDRRIDKLRKLMKVKENKLFTKNYFDPKKRSIANAIQIFFKDGSKTEKVVIHYPLGHRMRREEALALLFSKFKKNISPHFSKNQTEKLVNLFKNDKYLKKLSVHSFLNLFSTN